MSPLEKISRKITITLMVGQSLFSASTIMIFTVSSIIIVGLTGNDRWAGVPSTLVVIGAAVMAYPVGRLMDRVGRRKGLSVGYVLGIIGTIIAGFGIVAESLPLFLAGVFGLGLTRGVLDQGRYVAAEANPTHKRARALSWVVLGGTAGSVFGPGLIAVTGPLAERAGLPILSGPWFAATFFFGLAMILNNIFLRPDPQTIGRQLAALEPQPANPVSQEGRPYKEVIRNPDAKLATGALIFGQLTMVLVMTMTPLYMHHHHHPISEISWVIMAHTLGMFGLSFVTGWLVDRFGRGLIIFSGGIILIISCLLAPLSSEVPLLAFSLFLLGLGWNFCFVAGSTLLSDVLRPAEQGRIQGLTDTMINIVSGLGNLGGGLVFAAYGYVTIAWLGIAAGLIPVILVIVLRASRRQQTQAEGVVG